MRTREVIRKAKSLGADAGYSAATWCEIDERNAQRILTGFNDGDPEILDHFKLPDLSGEWADSPTPRSLAADIGIEDEDERLDDACTAWEDAVSESFWNEVQRRCKFYMEA
jgi:hypothetical protein